MVISMGKYVSEMRVKSIIACYEILFDFILLIVDHLLRFALSLSLSLPQALSNYAKGRG